MAEIGRLREELEAAAVAGVEVTTHTDPSPHLRALVQDLTTGRTIEYKPAANATD